jgi:hypothetical protein
MVCKIKNGRTYIPFKLVQSQKKNVQMDMVVIFLDEIIVIFN